MLRILLLDCSESLKTKLQSQGFHVDAGTAGYCTGVRKLPSQVYENDLFIYDPDLSRASAKIIAARGDEHIVELSPEYSLKYLESHIQNGATFLIFLNRLSDVIEQQNWIYQWIPFMPPIEFTSDRIVWANIFREYPDTAASYLAPIATTDNLSYPVTLRVKPPKAADYPSDVFHVFGNRQLQCLGVAINRGYGRVIVIPKFNSNEDVTDTFLHRVIPRLYNDETKDGLIDIYSSPAEIAARDAVNKLLAIQQQVGEDLEVCRVELASSNRVKVNTIENDETAKQIQIYYDHALRQGDAALYFLYKIIESIENKFGGESAGIRAVGEQTAWKAVKRLANESYRDARHAPKPGDVVKKWTNAELKQCFEDTKKVIVAYFSTLFPVAPSSDRTEPELAEGKV